MKTIKASVYYKRCSYWAYFNFMLKKSGSSGCCDGTELSATCAPYYPQCNSYSDNTLTVQPIPSTPVAQSNQPVNLPENNSSSINVQPTSLSDNSASVLDNLGVNNTESTSSNLFSLTMLTFFGVAIYYYVKNKKSNKK